MSWVSLRWSLAVGALYDAVFAGLMVLAPNWLAATFKLPLPGEHFYLWLLAVLLLMLAALYSLACRDPLRYSGVVDIAILGRALGALAFGIAAVQAPELGPGLWPVAAIDLGFAVWLAGSWWPHRIKA